MLLSMTRKWGESFLKSGLPLEHLTSVVLRTLEWHCFPHFEYERSNADGQPSTFEVDLVAETSNANAATDLHLLVECKYHDASRFWFFHPLRPQRFYCDERVFNPVPFQTLAEPASTLLLASAVKSYWGVVVSEDGQKQDNAIHAAMEQLSHAFVPYIQYRLASLPYGAHRAGFLSFCVVPVIVTNAQIFRLRDDVADLRLIREASKPEDVADAVPWTWCYNQPSNELLQYNSGLVATLLKQNHDETQIVDKQHLLSFVTRPNWVCITNVAHLEEAVGAIVHSFWECEIVDGVIRPER